MHGVLHLSKIRKIIRSYSGTSIIRPPLGQIIMVELIIEVCLNVVSQLGP